MPVTNPTALPAISFSKNPLWFYAYSSDFETVAPVGAVAFTPFGSAITAGAVLAFLWADTNVHMTAEAVPDNSGTQIPIGDGGSAYVTSLVPYFQANYFIDRDYVVSADLTHTPARLVFTAREPGVAYNMTSSGGGLTTTGVDGAEQINFAHHIEVWISDIYGNYQKAFDGNVPLDEPQTGYTTIDIHEILHSYLAHDRPVLSALYQQCVNSIRTYFVKYAQFFGNFPAVQQVKNSGNKVVTIGGLGMQANLLRNILTELQPVTGDATQNRFLRQGSKNILVTTGQPEWLTYINLSGASQTVNLEVIIYNDDASSFTFNAVAALAIGAYQKFQFQAGFSQLSILSRQASTKNPIYYTCRIAAVGGGYLTDTYAFVIDYNYREWPKYIVYENSYGAYQVVGTVGKGQIEFDRIKDDAQLALDRTTAAISGDFIECNILIQNKNTLAIGYDRAGKRNTKLLRDLLASHTVFIYDAAGNLIPIGFNTKNLKDAKDGDNAYANVLEYYTLYQEEVYTENPLEVADDNISTLLGIAGSPVPPTTPSTLGSSGTIVVEHGDIHLSISGGLQVFTDAYWLAGKTNYRIYSTQLGAYFRTEDITYNPGAGSFTILDSALILTSGDQYIIFPFILNP